MGRSDLESNEYSNASSLGSSALIDSDDDSDFDYCHCERIRPFEERN